MIIDQFTTPPEILSTNDEEDRAINKIAVEQLLATLKDKDRDIIVLWSEGHSLREIAAYISEKYESRPTNMPLTPGTIGARVNKILKRLRKYMNLG